MDEATFIALIEEILEVDSRKISLEDNLEEIDWDSLANITFIAEIDSQLGVRVDPQRLAQSVLVSDLWALTTEEPAGH